MESGREVRELDEAIKRVLLMFPVGLFSHNFAPKKGGAINTAQRKRVSFSSQTKPNVPKKNQGADFNKQQCTSGQLKNSIATGANNNATSVHTPCLWCDLSKDLDQIVTIKKQMVEDALNKVAEAKELDLVFNFIKKHRIEVVLTSGTKHGPGGC